MNDRTSYTTARSARQADFRQDLIDRDGTCVMSGSPPRNCQACHIIPHSKGDKVCPNVSRSLQAYSSSKYIIELAQHREESSLEGINDARNGLLLYDGFHRPFGESRIAFLRVSYYHISVFVRLNSCLDS